MFAVCRGKLSEGIDFSDDACRCVIMAGIPCAPIFNPDVLMKRQYIEEINDNNDTEQKTQYFNDAKRQIN
jgi:regulator of telomere elongation helicase 1